MKKMKLFLLTILSAMLIIGCTPKKESSTASKADDSKPAATKNDGTLNIANVGEKFGDKFTALWLNRGQLEQKLMFRSLFLPDADLKNLKPDLAKDYKVSDDQLTYTLNMKENVKWHDGQPLTAEDVVWSIGTVLKAAQVNAIYTSAFSAIEGADAWKEGKAETLSGITADGNTITVKLTRPVGNFIPVLGQFAIYPKHLLKDENPLEIHNANFWKNPIGNGMYKLEKLEPGNFAVFVPADTYEGAKPKIEKIVVTSVSEPISAAKAGKIDFFNTNVAEFIEGMKSVDSFKANPIDMLFYRYFIVNMQDADGKVNEKMADKRVREAILYAIDRKSLTAQLYPELATLLNTGVPSTFDEYDKNAPKYEYNPEKAKQLLKEANFDFNEKIKLRYYYGDQTSINFMTAVAQYLTDVGLKVDVLKFQGDATSELYQIKDYDIALKGLSSFGYEEWYGEYESSNANFVNIFGKKGTFDDAINRLKATSDDKERAKILKELQKLEEENLNKLPLYTTKTYYYINDSKVKTAGIYGNPWYNYDMKFEEWEIK
ncbi:oligopeptide ABC transporteroligopeptide-binding protein [Neobacillus bataviensis LMG 21833]|uniref:Oligopeptide ABC transporteroligopeptide-binding protein n=1 Tax=Neobacillus bataviensis LMG 21833 TaxID=1117379 RepID=K6DEL7_9BACI|nr:ABC transporter substrate-binding protein [Neobacillus bataviensis]EKN66493.1 oligopeptide ABC transporteroligopeptide-binding protein [Neobacillus bataviensis LMG 21833]